MRLIARSLYSRRDLLLEILALRQQLSILHARHPQPRLTTHDVTGNAEIVAFHEEEGVPSDSKVIGQTWAKANKDGSRDRRFTDNHQIPRAQYGSVTLKSDNGLWEEFEFSNPQRLVNFLNALNTFTASFAAIPQG